MKSRNPQALNEQLRKLTRIIVGKCYLYIEFCECGWPFVLSSNVPGRKQVRCSLCSEDLKAKKVWEAKVKRVLAKQQVGVS